MKKEDGKGQDDGHVNPHSIDDRYFDLRALEIYSGIPVSTLRHYLKRYKLPSFKVSGKIYVKRSEFDTWMEQFRTNATEELNVIVSGIIDNLIN